MKAAPDNWKPFTPSNGDDMREMMGELCTGCAGESEEDRCPIITRLIDDEPQISVKVRERRKSGRDRFYCSARRERTQ